MYILKIKKSDFNAGFSILEYFKSLTGSLQKEEYARILYLNKGIT